MAFLLGDHHMIRLFVAAVALFCAPLFAQSPIIKAITPDVTGCRIAAGIQYEGHTNIVSILPPPDGTVIDYYTVPGIERECWSYDLRLADLHLHVSMYQDQGSQHIDGSVLVLNSESKTPVGFVKPDMLAFGVTDGSGSFSARYAAPYDVELTYSPTHNDFTIWRLRSAERWGIRGGNMIPFVFTLSYGDRAYNQHLYFEEPTQVRVLGGGLIPPPDVDVEATLEYEDQAWYDFVRSTPRGIAPPLFGYSESPGNSGDQKHLGKHPLLAVNSLGSTFAADRARGEIYWVEGLRQYWYNDIPLGRANAGSPDSAYFWAGLHFTSGWQAGYTERGSLPPKGPTYGIEGYGLEHFRTTLPEIAMATQDPGLMWMVAQLGRVLQSSLALASIGEGGYFSGGFPTLRSWSRPCAELMEVILALESHGTKYTRDASRLRAHLAAFILRWRENEAAFRFSMDPARLDGYVPGFEGQRVSECWQAGIGGDYFYAWWLYTGDQSARDLASNMQLMHLMGWRGETARDIEMPKFLLATDWHIGGPYGRRFDALVVWNLNLMLIPGLVPGEGAEHRRQMIVDAILLEYPDGRSGKWGCGDWESWKPGEYTTW